MKEFTKNKIDTLADVFCAWIGGVPENDNEIKSFLNKNIDLTELLNHRDIEHIVHYHAFFPKETLKAVYSLLPPQVTLADGRKFAIFENAFAKLNNAESKHFGSIIVNVDMSRAYAVFMRKYVGKYQHMKKNYNKYRGANQKILYPDLQKKCYHRRRANMTPEELELSRKKSREYRRKWRAEHPEKMAVEAEKQRTRRQNRSLLQVINDRITSRKANRAYRENNREEIRERRNNDRARLKAENPELLKEMDRKHNAAANRTQTCRTYYQKHKEEINRKARNNPKVPTYKRRYQNKKRWQEKTGVKVMSLLQAIISAKQRNK